MIEHETPAAGVALAPLEVPGVVVSSLLVAPEPDPDWERFGGEIEQLLASEPLPPDALPPALARLRALLAPLETRGGTGPASPELGAKHANASLAELRQIVDERRAKGRDVRRDVDRTAANHARGLLASASQHMGISQPITAAADHVRALIGKGPIVRVPTEIPCLDRMTGGGLQGGKLINAIGGAPNAGKTSLAVQFAVAFAYQGLAVAIHCADEPREGILMRIGQQLGLAKEDLEQRNPAALEWLAAELVKLPNLVIVDQDEDEVTLEQTGAALVELGRQCGARGLVFVGDSIQKMRARGTDDARDPRMRAAAVVEGLKMLGVRTAAIIIATSEVSRAVYRDEKGAQTSAMAVFKESGDIEYAMRLGLVMYEDPKDPALVRVKVPKNKGASSGRFTLRRDATRCTYTEVPDDETGGAQPTAEDAGASPAKPSGGLSFRDAKDVDTARYALRKRPEGIKREDLVDDMKMNKSRARDAIRRLERLKEISEIKDGRKLLLVWRDPSTLAPAATVAATE